MRVTVYCASSNKVDKKYYNETHRLATSLIKNNCSVIYGGGANGLMGHLADTALDLGGNVVGIMPHFMTQVEWNHNNLTELILVDDMHRRKAIMLERAEAIVALAGGCGTLEELSEAITLKRLGKITCPIIIVNTDGFYNSLIDFLNKMIDENFLREEHREIWTVVDNADQVYNAICNAPKWQADAIKFAAV